MLLLERSVSKHQTDAGTKLPLEKRCSLFTQLQRPEKTFMALHHNQDINWLPITALHLAIITSVVLPCLYTPVSQIPFFLQWHQANPWVRALPKDFHAFLPSTLHTHAAPTLGTSPSHSPPQSCPPCLQLAGTSQFTGTDWRASWEKPPHISSVSDRCTNDSRGILREVAVTWLCIKDYTQLV